MNKIFFTVFYFSLLSTCLQGFLFAAQPKTTDDISLLNPYFYRLVQRADAIQPSKSVSTSFRPLAIREAQSLFGTGEQQKMLRTSAERYYRFEAEAAEPQTLSIQPLDELHLKAVHSDTKDAPLYGELGAELDGYDYLSLIGGGHAYWKDWMLFSGDVRASNDGDADCVDLFRYKLKTGFEHISLSAGKENIVVGPGYFGSLLMSDNVQPENSLILKTETPYDWGLLGAFRWYAWHVWYDDDERYNKDPRLLGARLSLKPWHSMELGFTRTAMYGGSKNAAYDSLDAYWEMFTATNENVGDNPYNSQQQAGFDVSLHLPFLKQYTPFAGGKLYAEYAFTDLKAAWQKEDRNNGVIFEPLHASYLAGLVLTTGRTDIVLEFIKTSYAAYSGGGGNFRNGYTDNSYIIGHYAGNYVQGGMAEVYHEWSSDIHLYTGLGYLDHRDTVGHGHRVETDFFAGAALFISDTLSVNLKGTYAHFSRTDINPSPVASTSVAEDDSTFLIHLTLDYHF